MEGEDLRTKKKLWVHGLCVGDLREYERGAPSTIDFLDYQAVYLDDVLIGAK